MAKSTSAGYLAAVCTATLITATAGGAAQGETLTEAMTMAYETNPTMLVQRSQARQRDEDYLRQHASRLGPTVTISSGYNVNLDGNSKSTVTSSPSVSLNVTQPLFTQGALNRALTQAEINLLQGRDTLRNAESQFLANVINAYVAVRTATAALAQSQAALTITERATREQEVNYQVGLTNRVEVERNRATLLSQKNQVDANANALAQARANYATLVGQNPGELDELPPLASVPATFEEALRIAQERSNTMRQALYTHRLAEIALANARVSNGPTASLSTSYSTSSEVEARGVNNLADNDRFSVGLNFSYTLFNSGVRGSNIRTALESRSQADNALEQTRRQLVQTVSQQWNNLTNARNNLINTENQVRTNSLIAEGQRVQVQQGTGNSLELLRADEALRTSQQNVINQRAQVYTTGVTLLNTIGVLDARTLIPNAQLYNPTAYLEQVERKFFIAPYAPVLKAIDAIGAPAIPDTAPGNTLPAGSITQVPTPLTLTAEQSLPDVVIPPAQDLPPPITFEVEPPPPPPPPITAADIAAARNDPAMQNQVNALGFQGGGQAGGAPGAGAAAGGAAAGGGRGGGGAPGGGGGGVGGGGFGGGGGGGGGFGGGGGGFGGGGFGGF